MALRNKGRYNKRHLGIRTLRNKEHLGIKGKRALKNFKSKKYYSKVPFLVRDFHLAWKNLIIKESR